MGENNGVVGRMVNSNLQSAVVLRILDVLGIFSKDMFDIRNEIYYISDSTWAGKLKIDDDNQIIFLYSEKNEYKYMITKYLSSASKSNWFNLVSLDVEDVDLNKAYISLEIEKELKFREISYMEISDLLKGFELIRQYMPSWLRYDPQKEDLDMLNKFINSIELESILE